VTLLIQGATYRQLHVSVSGPTSPAPNRTRDWEPEGEGAAKKWKPRGSIAGMSTSVLELLVGEVPDSRVVDFICAAGEWCASESTFESASHIPLR